MVQLSKFPVEETTSIRPKDCIVRVFALGDRIKHTRDSYRVCRRKCIRKPSCDGIRIRENDCTMYKNFVYRAASRYTYDTFWVKDCPYDNDLVSIIETTDT